MNYDLITLFDAKEDPKTAEEMVVSLVGKEGFKVVKTSVWGKKSLAYEIKKRSEALYVEFEITSPKSSPEQLYNRFKLEDRILRTLILKKKELGKAAKKE